MKFLYIIFVFLIISCYPSNNQNDNSLSCEEKINNFIENDFTLEYTRRKKLDTISSYKEHYLYQNIHVCDIKVYMEGRTAFNLMCWNDSIYFNDNIFSNQIYVYKKSLDISDQIIGMSSLYTSNLDLDSMFVRTINTNMLNAYSSMHFKNYSYSENFMQDEINVIIDFLEKQDVDMSVFKSHLRLSYSNKFYVVYYMRNLYIYSMYDARNYWDGKNISRKYPRLKLFTISFESDLQIPKLNRIDAVSK